MSKLKSIVRHVAHYVEIAVIMLVLLFIYSNILTSVAKGAWEATP